MFRLSTSYLLLVLMYELFCFGQNYSFDRHEHWLFRHYQLLGSFEALSCQVE
jgi:hypothetical protein